MAFFVPRPSARTAREFAFQIVTIIAGILIALALDGILERSRDRSTVRDTRAAIQSELRDNLRDLRETLPSMEDHRKQLEAIVQLSEDLLAKRPSNATPNLGVSTPSLNRASWQSADRTGALALMDFDDVREYSEVYELQSLVVESQNRIMERISGIGALMYGLSREGTPQEREQQDLVALRTRALDGLGAVGLHLGLARQLIEDSAKALER
jgi:hypothetical protein